MRSAFRAIAAALLPLAVSGCGDSSSRVTIPVTSATNVTVAVSPATAALDAGQAITLQATVTGDTANRGVTWVAPAGAGSVATGSGLTAVYTAPPTGVGAVTVTATSVTDNTKSATATVLVNALPGFASPGQLPQGYANVPYSATVAVSGGTGALKFALASGTLPTGLSLNSATGVLSGTPVASGSSTFTLAVTDTAPTPVTSSASFTLGISALQLVAPALSNTVTGRVYPAATWTAAYAQGAVTYAITAGSLPTGMALSSAGVLSGAPTSAGSYTFTVTATDSVGQRSSATSTIVVAAPLAVAGKDFGSLQSGTAFTAYTIAPSGGIAPYVFTLPGGSSVPPGLSLSAAGVLSGTPTTPGTYAFTINVADNNGAATTNSQSVVAAYSLTVTPAPLAITTTSLPGVVTGQQINVALGATGGVAPYTWKITAGSLPNGVSLTTAGALVGHATFQGTYTFTVQLSDSASTPVTATRQFTLTVAPTFSAGPRSSYLKGSYAFVFTGQTNGALSGAGSGSVFGADMAGSLTFDGNNVVTGELDTNSAIFGTVLASGVNGTYTIGSDNRGTVVLNYSGGRAVTLDIALSGVSGTSASRFRFIEADSSDPNNVSQAQGSGEAFAQTATDFTSAALNGRYVFRLNGETPAAGLLPSNQSSQFGGISAAGFLALDGAGNVVRGSIDAQTFSAAYPLATVSGSFGVPDNNGRGYLTLTYLNGAFPAPPARYVYYIVNTRQIVLMSIDLHGGSSLLAGTAYQQQQTVYNAASLSGTLIGWENTSTVASGASGAVIYHLNVTSPGAVASLRISNINGTASGDSSAHHLAYAVDPGGRVTLSDLDFPGTALPVFWLYDTNTAVGTELTNSTSLLGTLRLESQTALPYPYSHDQFSGVYGFGTAASLVPVAFTSGTISTALPTALVQDISSRGIVTTGASTGPQVDVAADGSFIIASGDTYRYVGYFVSPDKLVYFNGMPGSVLPFIVVAEH